MFICMMLVRLCTVRFMAAWQLAMLSVVETVGQVSLCVQCLSTSRQKGCVHRPKFASALKYPAPIRVSCLVCITVHLVMSRTEAAKMIGLTPDHPRNKP